jgi:hypothetical protein
VGPYVPINGFLAWLVAGWRLPWIVEPIAGAHSAYSVLMTREDEPA